MSQPRQPSTPRSGHPDPESMAELVAHGSRMAQHWPVGHAGPAVSPAPWSHIHGVRVPDRSARLVDGMPEYGN